MLPLFRAATDAGAPPRQRDGGFTLIEMMISLLIFGLLAAAGVALLSFSVRAQGATGTRLDDISALNRLSAALSADLAQAVPRTTRTETGDLLPAFTGEAGSGAVPMLRLVRGGWSNLDGSARAGEQKVEYRLDSGVLQRIAYPMLDGAAPLPPAAMLTHVRQVQLRYRLAGAWSDRWVQTAARPLPQALELRIVRDDGVDFRQLFLVGSNYEKRPDAP